MDTNDIINDYIKALQERAEQSGGGINYAMGFLYSTLKSLQFSGFKDLEQLQKDTQNLRTLTKNI